MLKKTIFIITVCLTLLIIVILVKSLIPKPIPLTANPAPTPTPTLAHTSTCQSLNGLPDHQCTPGAIDPIVTQANLFQTICVKGYTKTVRPPVTYTNKLKLLQIRLYGYPNQDPHLYEEDHLIPLELGGAPSDPKNLWPEPGSSPNPKDKIENLCHQLVCAGKLSLADAQRQIAANWTTACQ